MAKNRWSLKVLDKTKSIMRHILVALSGIVYVLSLGFILNYLCNLSNPFLRGGTLLAVQLIPGAIFVRRLFQSGIKSKKAINISNPLDFKRGWNPKRERAGINDIRRIFEKIEMEIVNISGTTTEDVIDVSWFLVTIWSFGSTLLALVMGLSIVCYISPLILALISLSTYYVGYESAAIGISLGESHLAEYQLIKRVKILESTYGEDAKLFINWKVKDDRRILLDFSIESKVGDIFNLNHQLGLSSKTGERVTITSSREMPDVQKKLEKSVGEYKWSVSENGDKDTIVLEKSNGALNIRDPISFLYRNSSYEDTEEVVNKTIAILRSANNK